MAAGAAGEEVDYASREGFLSVFPDLVETVRSAIAEVGGGEEIEKWQREMMEYTVPGGKLNRGRATVSAYKALAESSKDVAGDSAALKRAAMLGWCVEWLQAFFLVADDIMDKSVTRRGQKCWYRVDGVGEIAINDSFVLESHVYLILKAHFGGEACYPTLVELFREISWVTELGQQLDLTSTPPDAASVDLTRFSSERYRRIILLKTAYYSFYLPVALAVTLAGFATKDTLKRLKQVLLPTGELFQIQDDVLDCFGDPEVIGKVGTDIQDGKCTWLVLEALELCSAEQRAVLDEHYAKPEEEHIQAVKDLYKELGLHARFREYETKEEERIRALIDEAVEATKLPKELFSFLLDTIIRREK